jgi:preprotein translocase subunit SecB
MSSSMPASDMIPQVILTSQYMAQASVTTHSPQQVLQQAANESHMITPDLHMNVSAESFPNDRHVVSLHTVLTMGDPLQPCYRLDMVYKGEFHITNTTKAQNPWVLYVQCPHLLFPEVRHCIMMWTQQAGLAPVCIQPLAFAQMFQKRLEETQS